MARAKAYPVGLISDSAAFLPVNFCAGLELLEPDEEEPPELPEPELDPEPEPELELDPEELELLLELESEDDLGGGSSGLS